MYYSSRMEAVSFFIAGSDLTSFPIVGGGPLGLTIVLHRRGEKVTMV
jgi:hypothetical protein